MNIAINDYDQSDYYDHATEEINYELPEIQKKTNKRKSRWKSVEEYQEWKALNNELDDFQ